jgi:hypothetical protein
MKSSHQIHMIKFISLRGVLLTAAFLISSCIPADVTPIPITTTETPLPTSTIVWFPPSETPTVGVIITSQPTAEMRPGLGATLLTDDFSDPSLWDVAASDQGSAGIDHNSLTIAVQSNVYLASLRHELVMNDSYLEITARPSLCRGADSYGILVHANGSAYFRFALSCDGKVRADRVSKGLKLNLQKPLQSGDAPLGAPGEVRIGMWTFGTQMRLFLNGRFQFSVTDPSFPGGTLGVFVNSGGSTAAVVTFSDLVIQSIDYIPPTKTPLP